MASKSHASPSHFWMNGLPSHMLLPLDFGWMAHQVTCFSSTLWMNGRPSHMLLFHTLDEWLAKSHASLPHFGWMAGQVTCFSSTLWMNGPPSRIMLLPHTLDEWVSRSTICRNVEPPPPCPPIKYLPTSTTVVAPWSCMDHHNTSHIVQLTRVHDKIKIIPKMPQNNTNQYLSRSRKSFVGSVCSQFSVISSKKSLG
jgi:hypothetical protein